VALLGWSDGALVAAAIAGAGDRLGRGRCAEPGPSARPDALVAADGFFGWPLPVPSRYVTARAERFLGGSPARAPRPWRDATPFSWLDAPGWPDQVRLLAGTTDPLAADARRFAAALRRHHRAVRLVLLTPHGDQSLLSPRTEEGRAVVRETLDALTAVRPG
jgi:acetyl esterase/lipase